MGREFELKFRASANQLDAIRADFDGFREINMVTTYYDTPDNTLLSRHWTLRHRTENGVSVCTLKTPCDEGGRNEWEVECDDINAAIAQLCSLGAPAELSELVCGKLEATCSARFTRLAALVEQDGCTVELALDRGFLKGGFRMNLMIEVEVELKSGSDEAAIAFAKALAAKYGLIPERNSKHIRALSLTGRI
jgi:inorganic triphosphatase YgiF